MSPKDIRALVISFISVLTLGLAGLFISNTFFLFTTKVEPGNLSELPIITGAIDLTFNKELDPTSGTISSPQDIIAQASKDGKRLRISLKIDNLVAGQSYSVKVDGLRSKDGRSFSSSYKFKAINRTFELLSNEEQVRLRSLDDAPTPEDPVLSLLPHSTLYWEIRAVRKASSSEPGQGADLVITLSVSDYEIRQNQYYAKLKEYKTQALDYLKSKNVPVEKYTITYEPTEAASL